MRKSKSFPDASGGRENYVEVEKQCLRGALFLRSRIES